MEYSVRVCVRLWCESERACLNDWTASKSEFIFDSLLNFVITWHQWKSDDRVIVLVSHAHTGLITPQLISNRLKRWGEMRKFQIPYESWEGVLFVKSEKWWLFLLFLPVVSRLDNTPTRSSSTDNISLYPNIFDTVSFYNLLFFKKKTKQKTTPPPPPHN